MIDLERIKAYCDVATEGPWRAYGTEHRFIDAGHKQGVVPIMTLGIFNKNRPNILNDSNFVAAARTDLPKLVEEVENLRRLLKDAKCPICDGSGICIYQDTEFLPAQDQCEWCFRREALQPEGEVK